MNTIQFANTIQLRQRWCVKVLTIKVRELLWPFLFYDANRLWGCLLFYDDRGWIRSKCGEMSCLRRHWTTRQRTYSDPRSIRKLYMGYGIHVCCATEKQLNTYIDAYAGRIYGHLYLPSRIQTIVNARVTTVVKTFFKRTDFAISFTQSVQYCHREKWTLQYNVMMNFVNRFVECCRIISFIYLKKIFGDYKTRKVNLPSFKKIFCSIVHCLHMYTYFEFLFVHF